MSFSVKDILQLEVAPALGCTEPVAIALGAAAAASLLPQADIDRIEMWADPNIYKNGMAVVIPGTGSMIGLDAAAAVGAFGGDPSRGLEVLETVDQTALAKARRLLADDGVEVHLLEESGLHIRTVITSGNDRAASVIKELHTNIVSLTLNDTPVTDSPLLSHVVHGTGKSALAALEEWLVELTLEDIYELIDELDEDDLAFLKKGVDFNVKLAEHGLKYGSGLGIGKAIDRQLRQKLLVKDMATSARILTSAAADARMSGVNLPAMSSAGSGNHGLTAILPIWAIKDFVDHDEETVLRAIGLSHIVTAYVKAHTGRLSAVCGCSVAAGAGATAGITYLVGGDVESHGRGHQKYHGRSGRGDLRRSQGRLRPEAQHCSRVRCSGGTLFPAGHQRPGHRRHHRPIHRTDRQESRHPEPSGHDADRPDHSADHA